MDRKRRLRLAQALKSKDGASASPLSTSAGPPSSPNPQPQSATTPSTPSVQPSPNPPPSSPPLIAAMPLALAEASASSTPLDKGKRVMEVVSDDEDSAEGQVFKRQRTQRAPQTVTSATSSSHGAESLRENPPSATSPPQPIKRRHKIKMRPKPKAQAQAQEDQSPKSPSPSHEGQGQALKYSCIVLGGVVIK